MSTTASTPTPLLSERLEAQARQLMAAHVAHGQARGWDTNRARLERIAEIDDVLDRYNRATRR